MAISVDYAVEEAMYLSRGYVMMTIIKQQSGKLRNSDSIPDIGKGVLPTPKRPHRFFGQLCRFSRCTERSFCSSKTVGTWRYFLLSSLKMNCIVAPNNVCLECYQMYYTFITMTAEIQFSVWRSVCCCTWHWGDSTDSVP